MTNEEKAKELGQKYFPNENNIWARPNWEAEKTEKACIEMAEWKEQELKGIIRRDNRNSTHQYELGYYKGVEETREKMIEKASFFLQGMCEFLNKYGHNLKTERFVRELKQAMKGE